MDPLLFSFFFQVVVNALDGKIKGQKEIALTEYLQTTEAAKAVQTKLVADIAQGYYNLLTLDKQLEITKRNLVLSDSFLVATRLLKDAGLGNGLAVQQAEAQKQSTALLIPQLEQSIAYAAFQAECCSCSADYGRADAVNNVVCPSWR